jgi:hypothetical protein
MYFCRHVSVAVDDNDVLQYVRNEPEFRTSMSFGLHAYVNSQSREELVIASSEYRKR